MSKIDNSKYKWISTHMTNKNGTVEFTGYIQVLNTIEEKFNKFLATKRVNSFVNNISYLGIDNLLKKYNLQYLYKVSASKAIVMAYIRLKTTNIRGIRDYTHLPKQDYITTLPKPLTKEEIQKIWDAKENHKLGYAERMSMLEQHKIDRWEKENKPTYEQLRNDLFPRSIIQAFTDKMEKKREQIREYLSKKYPDPMYRPIYVRYYSTPEIIKEKLIGYVEDAHQIINTKPSFYTLKNVNKFLWNKLMEYKTRMKHIFNDDFICLKVMTTNNHVGCWV